MIGFLISVGFGIAITGLSLLIFRRVLAGLSLPEQLGVAGLFGLGFVGLFTLWIGLFSNGIRVGFYGIIGLSVVGLFAWAWLLLKKRDLFSSTKSLEQGSEKTSWIWGLLLGLMLLVPLVSALAPSGMADWDSLAYHFAVPKIWLEQGQITRILGIHHSHFPFTIENLFLWGLHWGGQSGAKAFSWFYLVLGVLVVWGYARRRYGTSAAWLSSFALVGIPVALWEAGTGYIDLPHALYSTLAVVYLGEALSFNEAPNLQTLTKSPLLWISAIALGFSIGTKYTGLQVTFVVMAILVLFTLAAKIEVQKKLSTAASSILLCVGVATLIGSSWYVRNVIWTGNPVFPFFYERLNGNDWDSWRASIYREEQQTFGVGKTGQTRDISQLPHAWIGLGYQPGRYNNPGQEQGNGFPFGALGPVPIFCGLALLLFGGSSRQTKFILGYVGLNLFLWFFLSQQSRYALAFVLPLVFVLGSLFNIRWLRLVMFVLVGAQAGYSFFLLKSIFLDEQLLVISGRLSQDAYLKRVPFYEPSKKINEQVKGGKVALYDEVFGYFLDVNYFWANPGHSKYIPHERVDSGNDYAKALKELGFSHVYINLAHQPRDLRNRWLATAFQDPGSPHLNKQEKEALQAELRTKWLVLTAEAASNGAVAPVEVFPQSVLFVLR